MRRVSVTVAALLVCHLLAMACVVAQESNGLAPEITDLNAKDISYGKEKRIPYLKQPFLDPTPSDLQDGISSSRIELPRPLTEESLCHHSWAPLRTRPLPFSEI